jgi:hypothetical protein
MLTIAGGIILAVLFLSAPGFWIMVALVIALLIIGAVLLFEFLKWVGAHALWMLAGLILLIVFGEGAGKEKKTSAGS